MQLVKQSQDPHRNIIGFTTKDYLELVDWAGRATRDHKRGASPNSIPPILERLKLNPKTYLPFCWEIIIALTGQNPPATQQCHGFGRPA
jgi:hypothetical protein